MSDGVSTALILLAVALSEGIRLVPAGAVVMRRVFWGEWHRTDPLELGRGFAMPAVAIPFVVAVVVPAAEVPRYGVVRAASRLHARLRRVRLALTFLRALGAASMLVLAFGIPYATYRSGWWGLIVSLGAVLVLAAVQAALSFSAVRRSGCDARSGFRSAIRVLWPFSTPRSAEYVLEQVVAGVPPLVAARALLPDMEFDRMVRALAYDVLQRGRDDADATLLRRLCGTEQLRRIVDARPADAPRFCPRCAAGYESRVSECMDCGAVPLVVR